MNKKKNFEKKLSRFYHIFYTEDYYFFYNCYSLYKKFFYISRSLHVFLIHLIHSSSVRLIMNKFSMSRLIHVIFIISTVCFVKQSAVWFFKQWLYSNPFMLLVQSTVHYVEDLYHNAFYWYFPNLKIYLHQEWNIFIKGTYYIVQFNWQNI